MRITISGLACSGKDTIGELLAKELGLKVFKVSMKELTQGKDILEFEKSIITDEIDKQLDEYQKELGIKEDNFVLISRLSAVNIPHADMKVWLYAPEEVRAHRISKRDSIPPEEALDYIKERDKTTIERIEKIYHIRFDDLKYYDIAINTSRFDPEECVNIIKTAVKKHD